MSYRAVSFTLTFISILCYALEISCTDIAKDILKAHNKYRAKHRVPPLKLDSKLSAYATEWAKHLAELGDIVHRTDNKYGENLYYGYGVGSDGTSAVDMWYDEIGEMDFKIPTFSSNTGHFTQVVWKNSRRLGVGVAKKGDATYIVCNYDPPGNILGEFAENVLRP